jgi:hypothetical protein
MYRERFAKSAHGGLAAISYAIEIVRRMATISQFHAPSSQGDAGERTVAQFFHAPIVSTLLVRLRLMHSGRQVSPDAKSRTTKTCNRDSHLCQR